MGRRSRAVGPFGTVPQAFDRHRLLLKNRRSCLLNRRNLQAQARGSGGGGGRFRILQLMIGGRKITHARQLLNLALVHPGRRLKPVAPAIKTRITPLAKKRVST